MTEDRAAPAPIAGGAATDAAAKGLRERYDGCGRRPYEGVPRWLRAVVRNTRPPGRPQPRQFAVSSVLRVGG